MFMVLRNIVPRGVFAFKGRKQWEDGEYFLCTGLLSLTLYHILLG
jgi:hypothetical protein